jgi:thiol:disulfide interchange protein DsbD
LGHAEGMTKDGKTIFMGYAVLIIALVAFGVILLVQNSSMLQPVHHSKVPWQPYTEERVAEALKAGKPVMIDFYAIWCGPCREMDSAVFSRQEVADAATNFLALRVDVSDDSNIPAQKVAKKFGITGLPTLVFLGTNGQERAELRLLGKDEPAVVIQRLKAAQ